MVNFYVKYILMAIKKKAQLVYLHIQIIVILLNELFPQHTHLLHQKSYFLGRNKYIIYLSFPGIISNCNKNQIAKVYKMTKR